MGRSKTKFYASVSIYSKDGQLPAIEKKNCESENSPPWSILTIKGSLQREEILYNGSLTFSNQRF